MNHKVAICIPTYNSESFIARTLLCAQNQTYKNIEIIVSVDLSNDLTAEICSNQANIDSRIKVIVQNDRLGWSQNANAVLDEVNAEYFFIYFHDDIIEPSYVEILLQTLTINATAASAHCHLKEFGLVHEVKPANPYQGKVLDRLVEFMMTQKGTTLRSLVRKSAVNNLLRFPIIPGDKHWTAYVFHMQLLAAGPAVAVNQILYKRWQRKGSLTRSKKWSIRDLESLLLGQEESIRICLEIINRHIHSDEERQVAKYCLKLFQFIFIRSNQIIIKDISDVKSRLDHFLDVGAEPIRFDLLQKENLQRIIRAEKKLKLIERSIALL